MTALLLYALVTCQKMSMREEPDLLGTYHVIMLYFRDDDVAEEVRRKLELLSRSVLAVN